MNYSDLHDYQLHAIDHIFNNPSCALFQEMGLGKTVATLTAIDRLMYSDFEVGKVLIIAPKRVAESVWHGEALKWEHLKHLTFSLIAGTERQRKEALLKKADIYVIGRDNIAWIVGHYSTAWPFDMTVADELSSFKHPSSKRFRALKSIRPYITRFVGLTGTPAPNSLLDIWSQIYLLDQGERLSKFITNYRDTYFEVNPYSGYVYHIKGTLDKNGKKLKVKSELAKKLEEEIYSKIGDICISMKASDYLTLPGRIERIVPVILHGKMLSQYLEFEKTQILAMKDVEDISVLNAAALTNKLLQFANGAVYDAEKQWHEVHNEKIEALEELLEAANGKPVLVFYTYKHDVERIMKHLKKYKPEKLEGSEHIAKWNRGEVPVLLAHPASAGHGLNMQAGGNIIVWFGLPWSLELYQQANARLDRQGQTEVVIVHRLIATGTMDEDVLKALESKSAGQEALMEAVKARIKKYVK